MIDTEYFHRSFTKFYTHGDEISYSSFITAWEQLEVRTICRNNSFIINIINSAIIRVEQTYEV